MTDAARLDTNPDLPGPGARHFPHHHFEQAGLGHLYGPIRCRCHCQLRRFENRNLFSTDVCADQKPSTHMIQASTTTLSAIIERGESTRHSR
jgi:hypothetical protein